MFIRIKGLVLNLDFFRLIYMTENQILFYTETGGLTFSKKEALEKSEVQAGGGNLSEKDFNELKGYLLVGLPETFSLD